MSFSKKISDLPEASSYGASDYIAIVQNNNGTKVSKKASLSSFVEYVRSNAAVIGATVMGVANPSDTAITVPLNNDAVWFAIAPGTYSLYGNIVVTDTPKLIMHDCANDYWSAEELWTGGTAITSASATVDSNVGTPGVTVSLNDGAIAFAFTNLKGEPGQPGGTGPAGPAGVTSASATVDANVGTPSVSVTLNNGALSFAFHNLKGEPGSGGSAGTLDTSNTTAQATNASESLGGTVNLHKVSKTGSYNDLLNKPTIPAEVTETTVANWGFTKNTGTVTAVKVNNQTYNPTSGVVDLGSIGGGGSSTLSGLSDVTLTSPASGHLLSYDGSKWVNSVAGNLNYQRVTSAQYAAMYSAGTLQSNVLYAIVD